MKKRIKITFIILLICSLFCFVKPLTAKKTYAENQTISNDIQGILDNNLYTALLWNNYNKFLPAEQREIYITKDMFSDCESLDLSSYAITSLMGLDLLNLESLKEINLSNNQLYLINPSVANVLSNIETLNLSHNNFTTIDLSSYTNLCNVDLSYNQLTTIDISALKENNNEINVNLMSNNIASENDIIIDSNKCYTINLIANELTNTESQFFTDNNVDAYIQNIKKINATTKDVLKIYNGFSMPEFKIKVTNLSTQQTETYYPNNQIQFGAGDYTIEFFNGDSELYNQEDITTYAYQPISYEVLPQTPTFQIYVKGELVKDINSLQFYEPVTITFESSENAIVQVALNNQNYITCDEIEVKDIGKHKISIIAIINQKQSIANNIYVTVNEQSNIPLSVLIISTLSLIVIIIGLLKRYAHQPVNFNKDKEQRND